MEHPSAKESSGPNDMPQVTKTSKGADNAPSVTPGIHDVKLNPSNIVPIPECRRSSRKKIIKFDVRDLLNKHRKPHKIQIEARIDSNVPNTSKANPSVTGGETTFTSTGLNAIRSEDLSSKQKAFMEKSAIFRRFSVSQDQSKPPPPPPIPLPPTILSKVGDKNNAKNAINMTGKRLNRSQEYYTNALLKPMPTTSLIVAQVESNVRSVKIKGPPHITADASSTQTHFSNPEPTPQKKRGRPPKIRLNEQEKKNTKVTNKVQEKTLSPEKAKNWKEYKACLAEQNTIHQESVPDLKDSSVLKSKPPTKLSDLATANKGEYKLLDRLEQPAKKESKYNENRNESELGALPEDQLTPISDSIGQPSNNFDLIEKAKVIAEKPTTSTSDQSTVQPQRSTYTIEPGAIEKINQVSINAGFVESNDPSKINSPKNEKLEELKPSAFSSISKEPKINTYVDEKVSKNTSTTSTTTAAFKYKTESFQATSSNSRTVPETYLLENNTVIHSVNRQIQNVKESNRTKRMQKQTKDTQRRQGAKKAIDVSIASADNRELSKSCNDNASSKHSESSFSATIEKCNDTSPENSSSDSLLVREVVEMTYKGKNDDNRQNKRGDQQRKSLRKRKTGTNKKEKEDNESSKELVKKTCEEILPKNEIPSQSLNIESCGQVSVIKTYSLKKSKEQTIVPIEESANNRETKKIEKIDLSAKVSSIEHHAAKDEVQTSNVRKSLRKQKDTDDSIPRTIATENNPAAFENNATEQTIATEKSKSTPVDDLECTIPINLAQNVYLAKDCENERDLSKKSAVNTSLQCENKNMSHRAANPEHVLNTKVEVSLSVPSNDQLTETHDTVILNQIQEEERDQKDKCELFSYEESNLNIENPQVHLVENAVEINLTSSTQICREENKLECENLISEIKSSEDSVVDDANGVQAEKVWVPNEDITEETSQSFQFRDEKDFNINTSREQSKTSPDDARDNQIDTEKDKVKDDSNANRLLKSIEENQMSGEECNPSALLLNELEECKQVNKLPNSKTAEMCHQLAEQSLNADKPKFDKRTSLRKQKESINIIPNDNTHRDHNTDDTGNKLTSSANKSDQDSSLENIKTEDEFVYKNLCNPSESSIFVLPAVSKASETFDDVPDLTKKRGRKNRFKNLHLSDLDSGDKSLKIKDGDISPLSKESKGNTTPDLAPKCEKKVDTSPESNTFNDDNNSNLDKTATESAKKQNESYEVTNINKSDLVTCQQTEQPQILDLAPPDPESTKSYVIKNLSIETNTLLDILRTVQSNEAAVGSKKESETITESHNPQVTPSESSVGTISVQPKLNESNSDSSSRSTSVSPLTTSKIVSSPRSDSSTPPVIKKPHTSPSRSNTSSPMSFNKKIARRYERRGRRGDDPTHKTLEETFAEIAALSSKAVLEMSNIEQNIKETEIGSEESIVSKTKENNEFAESSPTSVNALGADDAVSERKSNQPTSHTLQTEEGLSVTTPSTCDLQVTEYRQTYEKFNQISEPFECSEVSNINTEKPNNLKKLDEVIINASKDLTMDDITLKRSYNQDETQSVSCSDSAPDLLQKQFEEESILQKTLDPCDAENNIETKTVYDESCSSKSSSSKKDITQNKAECKSNKKLSKKSKKSEYVESEKSAENISISATTTPPPKRGRKPKISVHSDISSISPGTNSTGKKKPKKEQKLEEKEEVVKSSEIPDDALDEKIAKKKRQRRLREAFEAALSDQAVNFYDTPSSSPTFDSSLKGTKHSESDLELKNIVSTTNTVVPITATEPEEDPDPLKDIEKFIEDGVNLLKKDYKIDDDSVDNVIITNTNPEESDTIPTAQEPEDIMTKESISISFETPADTPITTPSVTPPPKSPESTYQSDEHSSGGIRRSHRIKLITKTPKALVGRGLVRDKERFSIKDDVETKSHYTLDDHLLDLAEVEAKNAKFLKEMEERLSNFQVIKDNDYKCERVISKEARKMICDCFLTAEEEERGELGCGEDCLNRLLMIECGPECNVRERCTNKRFQKLLCSPCRVFRTEKKGFGIMADIEILPGEFIMEYVGEVIDTEEFEKRRIAYSQDKNRHYYFMALRSDAIIDATIKGNISRFINHSCDPNAETQKWTVNGELRIGFFSRKSIMPGEEITFNYQYQRYGREAQRCYCESANCRGWIGQEPNSDEGEQIDDDEDESDEDDDEEENSTLLEDDADSDSSVSDPEEVQKKLELAAAQAAAELAPITMDEAAKRDDISGKEKPEATRSETEEEDSKSKFKKLLSKMAEKVAAKHKQTKKEQKLQRKKKSKESSAETGNKQRFLEDPDIEGEVASLSRSGLKNQSHTLRLSRLMVRAKLVQTRLNLLDILRKGELPCRRLFLDYHGLRLVHGWMSEDAGNMQIRLALLLTLELLPIANKSMLTDSKVMQVVRSWCDAKETLSPNEDSLSSNSNSQDCTLHQSNSSKVIVDESTIPEREQLQKLACKLVSTWENLPEIFRIPKKERIEQMKEHEREADRQYAETEESRDSPNDIDRSSRFVKRINTTSRFSKPHCSKQLQSSTNIMRPTNITPENSTNISKAQRREMFAAKVARDEAEKRMAEERREYETKCRFFGLDPKKTRPQDIPFYVNSDTGQWYSVERKPISTPPSYAHFPVPENYYSTNPEDYQLPAVCATLPPQWKYAITPQGLIYYYHVQYRVPQWEPPTAAQLHECQIKIEEEDSGNENTPTTAPESSDEDDEMLLGLDAAQLKAYIDRKVEARRQQRYQRLVDQRAISPRREEDRVYNQMEVRKYKENKEKIRKRKEDIRRKRAEASRQSTLNMCTLRGLPESNTTTTKIDENDDEGEGVIPIQDYLLSSDEDDDIKIEINIPLIDKIVEGDKIVDELDALTSQKSLKRNLPPHRDIIDLPLNTLAAVSSMPSAVDRQEHKKRKLEKKEKRKPKDQDGKYRKAKENFRCEIAGIIVHHLKPYRKDSCTRGRVQSNEDFNHLARKLTHFVMIKELKYCESVGQTLVVTESVKNKSREFIKKYMAKYGEFYIKPSHDPDFKDIPFTL